jgi:hypothetical protein
MSSRGRSGLLFEDDFLAPDLDTRKWLPAYLPHWSTLEATRPTYSIQNSVLRLGIAEGQKPWCPRLDGEVRVSNLQTGHFSGPVGSSLGQHHFREGLIVREAVAPSRLFVDRYFCLEMRARAVLGPTHLAALWLIGYEEVPTHSGEITVMEVFGKDATAGRMALGHGIKPINDPRLNWEFSAPSLPVDVRDWHVYGVEWRPDGVDFLLDGKVLSHSAQSPDYAMQLMLNLYDLPDLARGCETQTPPPQV